MYCFTYPSHHYEETRISTVPILLMNTLRPRSRHLEVLRPPCSWSQTGNLKLHHSQTSAISRNCPAFLSLGLQFCHWIVFLPYLYPTSLVIFRNRLLMEQDLNGNFQKQSQIRAHVIFSSTLWYYETLPGYDSFWYETQIFFLIVHTSNMSSISTTTTTTPHLT